MCIISHKHKFIFIRNKKTASSSMTAALSQFLGPDDFNAVNKKIREIKLTKEEKEIINKRREFNRSIQKLPHKEKIILKAEFKKEYGLKRKFRGSFEGPKLGIHSSWNKIRDHVGQDIWDEYFTFVFERNPWDKVASWYYFAEAHKRLKRRKTFSQWVKTKRINTVKNLSNYCDNEGNIMVDFVGHYENMRDDFSFICKKLNLDWDGNMPTLKSWSRKDAPSYWVEYDSETKKLVEDFYKEEIKLFGYNF